MIFYHNQLMKSPAELKLYLVSNPVAFSRYEDHEAALHIQMHELLERALEEKENLVALIEDNLRKVYDGGDTVEDMACFIIQSEPMKYAMYQLKENWDQLDSTIPEDSKMFSTGISRKDVVRTFSENSLRTYLETLGRFYHGF